MHSNPDTLQQIIAKLQAYWADHGCLALPSYDLPMGAGTFHPATFLKAIGPEPWRCVYVQPSRRPTDGRYGNNPNRTQHYLQMQAVLKPSPSNLQELYLGSLAIFGINPSTHDIRFVEDNWESPTLGASGLGWEVWLNGMEITQFTYFQQMGGLACSPVMGEITYGLERLALFIQNKSSIFEIVWSLHNNDELSYGDLFLTNEQEMSEYNFVAADVPSLLQQFNSHEQACKQLLEKGLVIAAYEMLLKASHDFNLLDARRSISVTERQRFILRIRNMAKGVAEKHYQQREQLAFPLCEKEFFHE